MPNMRWISDRLLGAVLNPFSNQTRQHIALIAFLAWVGLSADGLSSSCYGPEEAFLALGEHTHLVLHMAVATAITAFVIAVAYNQVIELFPSGGGGRVGTPTDAERLLDRAAKPRRIAEGLSEVDARKLRNYAEECEMTVASGDSRPNHRGKLQCA